ncbi:LOW QUALITY PROTEIN: nucleosome assembly protein 1-like 2 [Trichechus inunguis]
MWRRSRLQMPWELGRGWGSSGGAGGPIGKVLQSAAPAAALGLLQYYVRLPLRCFPNLGPAPTASAAATASTLDPAGFCSPDHSRLLHLGESFPAEKLMMDEPGEHSAASELGPLLGALTTAASPQALMGYSLDADFIESLPLAVKYRVYALKKLQAKSAGLEAKYLREFHSIERKFAGIYGPLLEKRRQIINALYEPTKEECEVRSEAADYGYNEVADDSDAQMYCLEENPEYEDLEDYFEDFADFKEVFGEYGGIEGHNVDGEKEDPAGIPDFWLTVLKNVEEVTPLIKKYDEPILKLLRDVKVKFSKPDEPLTFTLEFRFEPNDYFTNEVLTKTYKLKSKLDYYDPHPFRGSAVEHCIGCKIDWNEGKNVTMQTVLKKQRHRFWGLMRTVTQEFPRESFFNFFSALQWGLDANEDEEDVFIAHTLRTFVIPRAVLYFTGEALVAEQEGMIRECNNPVYDRITHENWVAAVEGAKGQDPDCQAEDIDR